MATYDLAIFDCDGVLFDSKEANRRYYNYISTSLGRGELTPDELEYVHMHTAEESIRFIFREMPEKVYAAFELAEEVGYDPFLQYMRVEDGMVETVELLRSHGVKTAVSTNRSTTMPRLRELFGLDSLFDVIVCALDVAKPKPHPEGVDKILHQTGVSRDAAIYIGDTEIDEKTAENSFIPLIAYKNPALKALHHVDRFPEIAEIILS